MAFSSQLSTSGVPIRAKRGIYTLGNDVVFDQLVALLNSIEVHVGSDMPVMICPYDDRMDRIREEISRRPNVSIFDDQDAIARWDEFTTRIWKTHPIASIEWQKEDGFEVHRMGVHRRFVGLDGPFDRYVYLDADILVLDSLEKIFAPLDIYDWVVYDFQHTDPTHVFNVKSPLLAQYFGIDGDNTDKLKLTQEPHQRTIQQNIQQANQYIKSNIFCSGMYASRSGLFSPDQYEQFIQQLASGEADMLYHMAPDQTILNYMVLRANASVYNLAHQLPPDQVTGCCVTSSHFQAPTPILPPLDAPISPASPLPTLHDRLTPLTYLHYIGISSKVFARLCAGENIECPYRDLFLYYRYLHEPDRYPIFRGKAQPHNPPPSFTSKVMRKLGLV
ncbi:MAG: hypothetical protein AAGD25_17170 [Cyanobacteria bacterium P01_F01_bin.150]